MDTMAIAHHPLRLFRLSCGCLRGYPMMPARDGHEVLCPRCRVPAVTSLVYPEGCCGARGWAGPVMVSCTRRRADCNGLAHLDALAGTEFTTGAVRLAAARYGRTDRA